MNIIVFFYTHYRVMAAANAAGGGGGEQMTENDASLFFKEYSSKPNYARALEIIRQDKIEKPIIAKTPLFYYSREYHNSIDRQRRQDDYILPDTIQDVFLPNSVVLAPQFQNALEDFLKLKMGVQLQVGRSEILVAGTTIKIPLYAPNKDGIGYTSRNPINIRMGRGYRPGYIILSKRMNEEGQVADIGIIFQEIISSQLQSHIVKCVEYALECPLEERNGYSRMASIFKAAHTLGLTPGTSRSTTTNKKVGITNLPVNVGLRVLNYLGKGNIPGGILKGGSRLRRRQTRRRRHRRGTRKH